MNIRTVWNLVNGSRGHVVAVLPCPENVASSSCAFAGRLGDENLRNVEEVGGISVSAAQYVIVNFPSYVGPVMVAGHPTWVAVPKQTCRHEKFRGLSRTNFPLVLCYGMTVHKSQGLTVSTRCVFNMEHEPTWSPFKNMCGLAFVGFSRVTDFSNMAFKHVPDYWTCFVGELNWSNDLMPFMIKLQQSFSKASRPSRTMCKDTKHSLKSWQAKKCRRRRWRIWPTCCPCVACCHSQVTKISLFVELQTKQVVVAASERPCVEMRLRPQRCKLCCVTVVTTPKTITTTTARFVHGKRKYHQKKKGAAHSGIPAGTMGTCAILFGAAGLLLWRWLEVQNSSACLCGLRCDLYKLDRVACLCGLRRDSCNR